MDSQLVNYPMIGDYTIIKTIGMGFNSKVKLAYHKYSQTYYAIKFLKKETVLNETLLRNETAILQKLKHPNLIRLVDSGLDQNYVKPSGKSIKKLFSVLELASGGQLFDFLAFIGPFGEVLARSYFKQIISALGFLHRNGICHRDLKPENLLLTEDFTLKIADFGFSRLNDKSLTTILGTPTYMAPEMHLKMPYSGIIIDLFAAAIILFVMVTGKLPFVKADPCDRTYKLLCTNKHEQFWKIHEINKKNVSESFVDLMNCMLAFDPTQRLSISEIESHKWLKGKTLEKNEIIIEMMARKKTIECGKLVLQEKVEKTKIKRKIGEKPYCLNTVNHEKKFRNTEKNEIYKKSKKKRIEPKNLIEGEKENVNMFTFGVKCDELFNLVEELTRIEFVETKIHPKKYKIICSKVKEDLSLEIKFKFYRIDENTTCLELMKNFGDLISFHNVLNCFKNYLEKAFS